MVVASQKECRIRPPAQNGGFVSQTHFASGDSRSLSRDCRGSRATETPSPLAPKQDRPQGSRQQVCLSLPSMSKYKANENKSWAVSATGAMHCKVLRLLNGQTAPATSDVAISTQRSYIGFRWVRLYNAAAPSAITRRPTVATIPCSPMSRPSGLPMAFAKESATETRTHSWCLSKWLAHPQEDQMWLKQLDKGIHESRRGNNVTIAQVMLLEGKELFCATRSDVRYLTNGLVVTLNDEGRKLDKAAQPFKSLPTIKTCVPRRVYEKDVTPSRLPTTYVWPRTKVKKYQAVAPEHSRQVAKSVSIF